MRKRKKRKAVLTIRNWDDDDDGFSDLVRLAQTDSQAEERCNKILKERAERVRADRFGTSVVYAPSSSKCKVARIHTLIAPPMAIQGRVGRAIF